MRRRLLIWTLRCVVALLLVVVVAGGLWFRELRSDQSDRLLRRGTLVEASAGDDTVRLWDDTGLEVNLRWVGETGETPQPLLLLLGGRMTGSDAVDLIGDPGGVVVAAIDYPYEGARELDGWLRRVSAVPAIQRAMLDTPRALSLALDWLERQPFVDPERVELCGVSLGVPFVSVAGANDTRFRRVWLVHGGAGNRELIEHNLPETIEGRRRSWAASVVALLAYHRSFEPERWVPRIAPRPVVVIAAEDDERLPHENVERLYRAAGEPRELIWTRGRHVGPRRERVIDELKELMLERVREGS